MKKLSLVILFQALFLITAYSQQQTEANAFVRAAYTAESIASMSPTRIEYLNYISEFGWEIIDIPAEKQASLQPYPYLFRVDPNTKQVFSSYLQCADISNFNILLYRYSINEHPNYYMIDGCQKLLVIKSHSEITKGYNEFRNL